MIDPVRLFPDDNDEDDNDEDHDSDADFPPDAPNNPTPQDILQELDSITKDLSKEWEASITFSLDHGGNGNVEDTNICQYIGKYKGETTGRLYFDTSEFPPPLQAPTSYP